MNPVSTIAAPLLIAAQGFTLVVTHTNGERTELPVENISEITFEEIVETENKLDLPVLNVLPTNYSDFVVQWYPIVNANSYEYTVDGGEPVTTRSTEFSLSNIAEGKHRITVRALSDDSDWQPSETAEAEIKAEFRLIASVVSVSAGSVSVKFISNSDKDYNVAIVPEIIGRDAAKRVAYIKENAEACQLKTVTAATESEISFENLEPGTAYCVVGFRDDVSHDFGTYVSTQIVFTPGAVGSIFPNGVSESGGFVDVDKVGNTAKFGLDDSDDQTGGGGGDDLMCWACTASGLIQWWLDEYKRVTGDDYQLKAELPSHGIYTTDVMESMVRTYPNEAGDALMAFKWFFTGVTSNMGINGVKAYNENYEHWKGGFMGMSKEETDRYINVSEEASDGYGDDWPFVFNRLYSLKNLTMDEAKKKFSRIMIETLQEGPIGMIVPDHSVSVWGCDYTVDNDGDPIVTALYVGENNLASGNILNGLNKGSVVYETYRDIWFYLPSMNDGGSVQTTRINSFFGIKGYKAQ